MKLIPLSRGMFAKVDDEDYDLLINYKWQSTQKRKTFYAINERIVDGKKIRIKMHRFLLGINDSNVFVDHKDMNGLNNQKDNIRIASRSQNGANVGVRKGKSSSNFLGVFYSNTKNDGTIIWKVQVRKNCKCIHIGCFDDENDAAKAYNDAAIKYHGSFANLNTFL